MTAKIVHYSPRFFPLIGGVEYYVDKLTKCMPEYDFEILSISIPGRPNIERNRRNVVVKRFRPIDYLDMYPTRIPWKVRLLGSAIGDLLRNIEKQNYMRKTDFNLLHVHEVDIWNLLRLDNLLRSKQFFKIAEKFSEFKFAKPVLLTKHSFFTSEVAPKNHIEFEERFVKNFDNIICVSKLIYENVKALVGGDKRIFYIPGSIDTDKFAFTPIPKDGKLKVGFVGRVDPTKGGNILKELVGKFPRDMSLFLALSASPDIINDFKNIVSTNRKKNIYIYPNATSEEVLNLLKRIDIFLNLGSDIGTPLATLEAMSCGRPVIKINKGNLYPVIDQETGYIVEADTNRIFELLNKIGDNKADLISVGKRSREIVEKEFSDKVVIPKIKKIYDSLL